MACLADQPSHGGSLLTDAALRPSPQAPTLRPQPSGQICNERHRRRKLQLSREHEFGRSTRPAGRRLHRIVIDCPSSATYDAAMSQPPDRPILVVDDDVKIVRLVRMYLERAGYRVIEATDGRSALSAIALEAPAM